MHIEGRREDLEWLRPGAFSYKYFLRQGTISIDCAYHWHPCVELLWWERGTGFERFGGHDEKIQDGLVNWINSYVPHSFIVPSQTNCRVHVFQFAPVGFQHVTDAVRPWISIGRGADSPIARFFGALTDELRTRRRFSAERIRSLAVDVSIMLARGYTSVRRPKKQVVSVERFSPLVAHIEAHSDTAFSTRDAARMAGLSEGAFCRKFKAAFGMTFIEFLNHLRIDRVKQRLLLRNQPHTIGSIALAAGFSDLKYFNTAFRRMTGLTPSAFRSKYTRNA